MLTFDVKRKINTLRDILVGKVPDPKAQVEQITIALIYKFMDDMDIEGLEFGGTRQFFTGEYEKYSWKKIMSQTVGAQERYNLYTDALEKFYVHPTMDLMFREMFKNATFPIKEADFLTNFLNCSLASKISLLSVS